MEQYNATITTTTNSTTAVAGAAVTAPGPILPRTWSTATSAEEHAVLIVRAGPCRLCTLATRAANAEMEEPIAA